MKNVSSMVKRWPPGKTFHRPVSRLFCNSERGKWNHFQIYFPPRNDVNVGWPFFFGTGCCCFRGAGHFVRTNHRSGPTFSFYVPVWIFTVVISGRLNRIWCRSKNNGFDFCRLNSHRFTQFGRISLHFNLNFKYLYLTKYSSNWGHT